MGDYPTSSSPIRTIGRREVYEVNGRKSNRKIGTQEWTKFAYDNPSSQAPALPPRYISLVHQAQGPGKPLHWSLLVAYENQPGFVYQVKGDGEHMRYSPSAGTLNILQSVTFLDTLAVVTEEQEIVVSQVAERELSPRAANRQSITENSQGWTVRVIAKMVELGIVPAAKLQMARSMLQPV